MNSIIIRKITPDEVEDAMQLSLEVFMEFEAPDYGPLGVEVYLKLGLVPQSEEQKINGIRFTPMKYYIKRQS